MNKKQVEYITTRHYRQLKKHLKKVAGDFEAEAIHQFRVSYKKLRAFLRLISHEHKTGEPIKISKKLKRAYNISGVIRNLQLQQQRILEATKRQLKKPTAYIHLLQKEIDKLKPVLLDIIAADPVDKSKKKTIAAVPDKFQLSWNEFIREKWAAINTIITSRYIRDDNLHTVRKSLKDLYYNLKNVEGVNQYKLSQRIWKGKDELYFDQLLDELGNYQDKCTAISLIKPYWLNNLKIYNRNLLQRLKKLWIKDKRIQKKLLVKQLKHDLAPGQSA